MGTRLSEETNLRPKPMVEIGGKPILWHIMKINATYGVKEFIVALGYKSEMIKEYFLNFYAFNKDISVDLGSGKTTIHDGMQHEDLEGTPRGYRYAHPDRGTLEASEEVA